MSKPRYPRLPPLPCSYLIADDDGWKHCTQGPRDHLHTPAENCDKAPERHHLYTPPKRHRHLR